MPRTHRPYPPEFRAEAVRLVRESGKPMKVIAQDLGIALESLRKHVSSAGCLHQWLLCVAAASTLSAPQGGRDAQRTHHAYPPIEPRHLRCAAHSCGRSEERRVG